MPRTEEALDAAELALQIFARQPGVDGTEDLATVATDLVVALAHLVDTFDAEDNLERVTGNQLLFRGELHYSAERV